jgi:hypothetical protein
MPKLDRLEIGGESDAYEGRGVWVPDGMTAAEIMEGARVLEDKFGVEHYTARSMVRNVLEAIRAEIKSP